MLNVEYFPPCRRGVAAASTKSCEATESAADGREARARSRNSGQLGEIFKPEQFRRTDHPGRTVWNGSIFIYGASTPPLLPSHAAAPLWCSSYKRLSVDVRTPGSKGFARYSLKPEIRAVSRSAVVGSGVRRRGGAVRRSAASCSGSAAMTGQPL